MESGAQPAPLTPQQLSAELRSIYAELCTVEAKWTRCSLETTVDFPALIALHRELLKEHHDFLMASQYPSVGRTAKELAVKYSMPARMWKHGIHNFLELLRYRMSNSLDHMSAFVHLAYRIMALLFETVPLFKDIWIEFLGDLGRYRMAFENENLRDREVWTGVARFWYTRAAERDPYVGGLRNYLEVLSRKNSLQQLKLYCKALAAHRPFQCSRETAIPPTRPNSLVDDTQPRYFAQWSEYFQRLHWKGKRAPLVDRTKRWERRRQTASKSSRLSKQDCCKGVGRAYATRTNPHLSNRRERAPDALVNRRQLPEATELCGEYPPTIASRLCANDSAPMLYSQIRTHRSSSLARSQNSRCLLYLFMACVLSVSVTAMPADSGAPVLSVPRAHLDSNVLQRIRDGLVAAVAISLSVFLVGRKLLTRSPILSAGTCVCAMVLTWLSVEASKPAETPISYTLQHVGDSFLLASIGLGDVAFALLHCLQLARAHSRQRLQAIVAQGSSNLPQTDAAGSVSGSAAQANDQEQECLMAPQHQYLLRSMAFIMLGATSLTVSCHAGLSPHLALVSTPAFVSGLLIINAVYDYRANPMSVQFGLPN